MKEKIDQETSEVLKRKEDMDRMKEEIASSKAEETRTLQEIMQQQQLERERTFAEQQVKEVKERQKNKLLEELEVGRKIRSKEVLQELLSLGEKKIGSKKIQDMLHKEEYDYDEVMSFYQRYKQREKEAVEVEKQKKLKEVEYLARAIREEEKLAIIKYAQEHGEEEMKQIQHAVRERHEKELKMKRSLEQAQSAYAKFHEAVMAQRRIVHEDKMQDFIRRKGEELQRKIVAEAQSELKKVENVRKVKEAEEKRKRDTLEKERKQKAEGTFVAPGSEENDTEGWGRATAKQPEVAPRREEPATIGRSAFGQSKPQEKPEEISRKPTYFNSGPKKEARAEDSGFMSRSQMGSEKPTAAPPRKEEEKKKPLEKTSSDGAGLWRTTA